MTGKRKTYLDFLRIVAIFMVVYVHTGPEATQRYLVAPGTFVYWFSLALNSLMQVCAPLFFMISGALLLHKTETLKDVLTYRVLRFFVLLMVFGLIEYAYFYHLNPEITFSIKTFFYLAYSTTIIQQYWFLYAYLAFLLILPFVRMMAQNMEDSHFYFLAIVMFAIEGLCPIIEYLWGNSRIAIEIPLLTNIIIYPLMGYFLEHRYDGSNQLLLNIGFFASILTNTIIGHMAIIPRGGAESLDGMTFITALAVFWNVKLFFAKHPAGEKTSKVITFLGSGSICVFLLEPPLRDGFKTVYTLLEPYITWFPAAILWVMAACLAGIGIYHLLRLIPGVKKVL